MTPEQKQEFEVWFENEYGWVSTRDPMACQHKESSKGWARAGYEKAFESKQRLKLPSGLTEAEPCGNCGGEGRVRDYRRDGEDAVWQTCHVCKGNKVAE